MTLILSVRQRWWDGVVDQCYQWEHQWDQWFSG